MMTLPLLITALWAIPRRYASAFVTRVSVLTAKQSLVRLSSTSSNKVDLDTCLSRLSTLQTLLSKHGAPGSIHCRLPKDLKPVISFMEMPELLSALTGGVPLDQDIDLTNLHPYLFPIAQSKSSPDVLICAYRNPSTEESDYRFPWPIVETRLGGPGFRVLALNSEHLMRRIACESDDKSTKGEISEIVALYNDGIGRGRISDPALDTPYKAGAVAALGYGVDKYVLLRVGPFPDLYEAMSMQHRAKGDEQSSLIAAEASNKKLGGFGSTFLHYARLLASFPNRQEESRDAARMCLRLPLSTTGMAYDDLKEVAVLGQIADESDSVDEALQHLSKFYDKMREVEQEKDQQSSKTAVQVAIEEANHILDKATLSKTPWSQVRESVGEKMRVAGRSDFARFVDYKSS